MTGTRPTHAAARDLPTILVKLTNTARTAIADVLSADREGSSPPAALEFELDRRLGNAPARLRKIDQLDDASYNKFELDLPLLPSSGGVRLICVLKTNSLEGTFLLAVWAKPTRHVGKFPIDTTVTVQWGSGHTQLSLDSFDSMPTTGSVRRDGDQIIGDWGVYLDIQEKAAERREWHGRYERLKVLATHGARFRIVLLDTCPEYLWRTLDGAIVSLSTARTPSSQPRIAAKVIHTEESRSELILECDPPAALTTLPRGGVIEVKDIGTRTEVRRQRDGIHRLLRGTVGMPSLQHFLFADTVHESLAQCDSSTFTPCDFYLEQGINTQQRAAVNLALHTPDVALIQGPPGTGKTTVIAEICYQLAKRGKRILVASQTNLAVDNALAKLARTTEVLATRLSSDDRKLEDEALDFVGDRAVARWVASHIQQSQQEQRRLQACLDLEHLVRVIDGDSATSWLDHRIDAKALEQIVTHFQQDGRVSDAAEDSVVMTHPLLGMDTQWCALLNDNRLDHTLTPSEVCRLASLRLDTSSLQRTTAELERCERLHAARAEFASLTTRRNQIHAGIARLEYLRTLPRHAHIRCEEVVCDDLVGFDTQCGGTLGLLGDVLRMLRRHRKEVVAAWPYRGTVSRLRSRETEGCTRRLVTSRIENLDRWSSRGTVVLCAPLARAVTQRHLGALVCQIAHKGAVLTDLLGDVDDSAVLARKESVECEWESAARDIQRLEDAVGALSAPELELAIDRRRSEVDSHHRASRAASVLERWRRVLAENRGRTRARARLLELAMPGGRESTIRERLRAAGISEIATPAERGRVERKIAVIKEWIRACQESSASSPSIRSRFDSQVNVVGATCSYAGSKEFQERFAGFDHVIIDEVSKATPTEMLMPAVLGGRLVLVGDHKQLPPVLHEDTTFEEEATALGINTSDLLSKLRGSLFKTRFEELETRGDPRCIMLFDQYRMHPDIMDGVNQFYDGKLRAGVPDLGEKRRHGMEHIPFVGSADLHVVWLAVPENRDYQSEAIGSNRGQRNRSQARVCKRLLDVLSGGDRCERASDIGLITPYRGQWQLYKSMVQRDEIARDVRVATIDRFQGMEREIVIVDLVHNHPTRKPSQFLDQHERINVAMSRARSLLIIVGSYQSFVRAYGNKGTPYAAFYHVARQRGGLRTVEELDAGH